MFPHVYNELRLEHGLLIYGSCPRVGLGKMNEFDLLLCYYVHRSEINAEKQIIPIISIRT